jgi:hypothetical protein
MAVWCVLVYMSVSPDLEESLELDLAEAADAVQMALDPDKSLLEVFVCINRDMDESEIRKLHTAEAPERIERQGLDDFLQLEQDQWEVATNRVLVVWGHGPGVLGGSEDDLVIGEVPQPRAILRAVFPPPLSAESVLLLQGSSPPTQLKPPDVVGYDACSMGSLEVGWTLRGLWSDRSPADPEPAVITSQVPEPASGWPYHKLLRLLQADPGMTPKTFARGVVDVYADNTDAPNYSIAAFDPLDFEHVRDAIRNLSTELEEDCPPILDILDAASRASLPDSNRSLDVGTFVGSLDLRVDLKGNAQHVQGALARAVIHRRTGGSLAGRSGFSLDLPDGSEPGFRQEWGSFAESCRWDDFWRKCVRDAEKGADPNSGPGGKSVD